MQNTQISTSSEYVPGDQPDLDEMFTPVLYELVAVLVIVVIAIFGLVDLCRRFKRKNRRIMR
jgi:flagellar biogenesis protein FliO